MKVKTWWLILGILSIISCSFLNVHSVFAANNLVPAGLANGAGVWANIWNYPNGNVDAYCNMLRTYGVRNFFIQTTRTNMPAIAHPAELGQLIAACHRHKIRVIAWAYLELNDPQADAEKMLAAARFQTPAGESIDAIAPDLEKNLTQARLEKFSNVLRQALGPNYPMIACVYSPLNHCQEVAHIPWKLLAQYYDVIAPMSYWNSKYQKLDAYDYTIATVRTIRQLTGRPDIEIHVIGDAMGSSGAAIQHFLTACRRAEATGASIYPNQKPTQDQLVSLSRYQDYFQPNSRFRLAAFRELLRAGVIQAPEDNDPTEPISRTNFYRTLAKHCHISSPAIEETNTPIYPDEVLSSLAQAVDAQPLINHNKKRADRWFAAPAMAESQQQHVVGDQPLNYLDAAQVILEAGSSIH